MLHIVHTTCIFIINRFRLGFWNGRPETVNGRSRAELSAEDIPLSHAELHSHRPIFIIFIAETCAFFPPRSPLSAEHFSVCGVFGRSTLEILSTITCVFSLHIHVHCLQMPSFYVCTYVFIIADRVGSNKTQLNSRLVVYSWFF